jgi:hypothetical protein
MAPAHREGVPAHLRHGGGRLGEPAATAPAGRAGRLTRDRAGLGDSSKEQTAAAEAARAAAAATQAAAAATQAAAAAGRGVACFQRRSRGSTDCRSAGISTRRAVPDLLTLPTRARMLIRTAFLHMSAISGIRSQSSTAMEPTAGRSQANTEAGGDSGGGNFGFCAQT